MPKGSRHGAMQAAEEETVGSPLCHFFRCDMLYIKNARSRLAREDPVTFFSLFVLQITFFWDKQCYKKL
jgi:hypothetical protein